MNAMLRRTGLFFAMLLAANGQWVNYKVPGIPRTKDGKPNLTSPTPRLNGKPDLNGLWRTDAAPPGEIEKMLPGLSLDVVPGDDPTTFPKYFFNALADYKPDEVVMSAEAFRLQQQRIAAGETATCLPTSIPMINLIPFLPHQFVQTSTALAILNEGDPSRLVHLDGRKLPVDPQPAWMGYSIGRWDGETLVVETSGISESVPLDGMQHPHSADARIIERLRRRDFGHLEVQVIIEDPKFYSKPITYKYTQTLAPDDDLLEWVCENEKDSGHLRR